MNQFRVVSPFTPQGDQPQAIDTLAKGVERGDRLQVLLGVTGSGKTFTMAKVIERVQRPTLVIAHRRSAVKDADQIIVLKGQESGPSVPERSLL